MFRGKGNTELILDHFSVGSIIDINGGDAICLVIGSGKTIRLLSLSTFQLDSNCPWVEVEDINFLTIDDIRKLIQKYQVTFSDNDYNPIGLKELKYKNGIINVG